MMQDDAGKTPETPRWEEALEGAFGDGHEYTLPEIAERLEPYLTHLEGALREAQKDIAFIHEQHDEEAVRVYAEIWDLQAKLREAEVKATLAALADEIAPWLRLNNVAPDRSPRFSGWLTRYDALQQPKAGAS